VFTRATDERLTGLVKAIDAFVSENKSQRMTGFVVLLAENNGENKAKLVALAKTHDISIPLTLAVEGAKGPGAYKLHPDVPVTVLAAKSKKVEANFALAAAADADAQKKEAADILAAAKKLLD